ncbi:MAG TPA: MlaD family protein, partial [Tepidisphaeraceae bacterium]|nr:MlaD family protein [Tepidisphaeraceae bacterium]
LYLGVNVGRVVTVNRSADQRSVIIDALVDQDPPLPGNVEAVIRTQLIGGGSSVSLLLPDHVEGIPNTHPTTQAGTPPVGQLQPNQQLRAKFVGVDILPPEISDLAKDLTLTSRELRRVGEQFRESQLVQKLVATVDNLNRDITKAGNVLDKVDSLVGDENMRKSVQESLANFREVSETAKRIGANFEKLSANANVRFDQLADRGDKLLVTTEGRIGDLSKQLTERMGQVDAVLKRFESISKKMDEGNGTAGMLLNNPALYESLLDASRELKLTVQDIRRTVQGWEQEGLPFRLR